MLPPYTHLIVRRDGPVEHVLLNRPDVRNAFNEDLIAELTAWAGAIANDTAVRVAVLGGMGKVFCAGADVTWMAKTVHYSEEENIHDATKASQNDRTESRSDTSQTHTRAAPPRPTATSTSAATRPPRPASRTPRTRAATWSAYSPPS